MSRNLRIATVVLLAGILTLSSVLPASALAQAISQPPVLIYGTADLPVGTQVHVDLEFTLENMPGFCGPGWPPQVGTFRVHNVAQGEVLHWGQWWTPPGGTTPEYLDNIYGLLPVGWDDPNTTQFEGIPFYCGVHREQREVKPDLWLSVMIVKVIIADENNHEVGRGEWWGGDIRLDLSQAQELRVNLSYDKVWQPRLQPKSNVRVPRPRD